MRSALLLIATTIGTLAAPALHSRIFDAVAEFSATSNTETQTWSYRYSESGLRDGAYTLLPEVIPVDVWQTDNGTAVTLSVWYNPDLGYPAISANRTNARLHRDYCCGNVYLAPRSIFVDPGTQVAVLSFLAPIGGQTTVTYSFTDIDCHGGNGINWYVDKNSGLQRDLASGFLQSINCDDSQYATTGLQTLSVRVKRGDRINFIIENGGDYTFDSSELTATISLTR